LNRMFARLVGVRTEDAGRGRHRHLGPVVHDLASVRAVVAAGHAPGTEAK